MRILQFKELAGADVSAAAYTLACFLQPFAPFDLILYGKHSTDGDTGQTGAMLTDFLHVPHVSIV